MAMEGTLMFAGQKEDGSGVFVQFHAEGNTGIGTFVVIYRIAEIQQS